MTVATVDHEPFKWVDRRAAQYRTPRPSARALAVSRPGYIYVARLTFTLRGPLSCGLPGWKVGRTTNLPERMSGLAGDDEMHLVAIAPATQADECQAHRDLEPARIDPKPLLWFPPGSREWYVDCDHFTAWLAAFPAVWRGSIRCQNGVKWRARIAALWRRLRRSP